MVMQNTENNNDKRYQQIFNLSVMAAGSWLIWYYSGPIASEVGRNAYEFIYDKLWGTPQWLSWRAFERAFYYIPNRGHVGNWLFNYAEYLGPLIAAPFLYKLPDLIRSRFKKRVKQIGELAGSFSKQDEAHAHSLSLVVSGFREDADEDKDNAQGQTLAVYTPSKILHSRRMSTELQKSAEPTIPRGQFYRKT